MHFPQCSKNKKWFQLVAANAFLSKRRDGMDELLGRFGLWMDLSRAVHVSQHVLQRWFQRSNETYSKNMKSVFCNIHFRGYSNSLHRMPPQWDWIRAFQWWLSCTLFTLWWRDSVSCKDAHFSHHLTKWGVYSYLHIRNGLGAVIFNVYSCKLGCPIFAIITEFWAESLSKKVIRH